MRKRKRVGLQPPTSDRIWFLDLGCGIGGLSLGFFRSGYAVVGVDKDPDCVTVYRKRMGDALLGAVAEVNVERRFHVVGSHVSHMGDSPRWAGRPGTTVTQVIDVGVKAQASAILVMSAGSDKTGSIEKEMKALFAERGYYMRKFELRLEQFGIPQRKRFMFFVGFFTKRSARVFSPPHPLTKRANTVYNALGLPFDGPSPPITSSERKSGIVGIRGGSSRPRRACEKMAELVGVSQWRSLMVRRRLSLTVEQLATLQGLPPEWKWRDSAREAQLVGRATPPVLAHWVSSRIWAALRDGGDSFAHLRKV